MQIALTRYLCLLSLSLLLGSLHSSVAHAYMYAPTQGGSILQPIPAVAHPNISGNINATVGVPPRGVAESATTTPTASHQSAIAAPEPAEATQSASQTPTPLGTSTLDSKPGVSFWTLLLWGALVFLVGLALFKRYRYSKKP